MSTLTTKWPTLLDLQKTLAPDGSVETEIVEMMAQATPIIEDMPVIEGNLPTGHKTTFRTGLPAATWKKINGGIQPTKGTTEQVTFNTGMLRSLAEQDADLIDMQANPAQYRKLEDQAHILSMGITLEQAVIYSDERTTPEQITGFARYFDDMSAESSANVIDAGGTGSDNTSMYLVGWGTSTVFGIYPRGSRGGITHKDYGKVMAEDVDGNGGRNEIYRTLYRADLGLVVRDWRYIVRVANIDVSDLDTLANTKNLISWMIEAEERMPRLTLSGPQANTGPMRPIWYANGSLISKLRLGILEKVASNLTLENFNNRLEPAFNGIPIHRTDAILNTEGQVT